MHFVKIVQVRCFFWPVFRRIRTEYEKIRTRKNFIFGYVSHSNGKRQAKLNRSNETHGTST